MLSIRGCLVAMTAACAMAFPDLALAQPVCRPNALGQETCRAGAIRPMPRPEILEYGQGLELVVEDREPAKIGPVIIPARKRTRLGTTLPDRSDNPIGGSCRQDRLGNLVCQ